MNTNNIETIIQEESLSEENWQPLKTLGIDYIFDSGQTALGLSIETANEHNVYFLLQKGANANLHGFDCNPPILDAWFSGKLRIVILLLIYGADPAPLKEDIQFSDIKDSLDIAFRHYKYIGIWQ
ncbi:hypothetical protein ICN84_10930 [Akkermansia glycaniphila]|uniref:hypothetical protein n=1 Tax=Akkermansia glycaniphila TaxID=1679444 RepID=UPI001C009095|nr:hypothetical protein [Akkermansia glycaniphila]MBT9450581.1 hypothetical protein [Akkermansia glycaniphila]